MHVIRQMLDDVSELVHLAALHPRRLAEEIPNCAPKRLRTVDYSQPRARGIEAPIDELGEQCLHHGGVLGATLAKPKPSTSTTGKSSSSRRREKHSPSCAADGATK